MKKILFISNVSDIGGANNALAGLIDNLDKKLNVSIVLPEKGDAFNLFNNMGLNILIESRMGLLGHSTALNYPLYKLPHFVRDIFKLLLSILAFLNIFKKFKPDIIHLNSSVLFGPAIAAKLLNIKIVWHIREHIIVDFRGRLFAIAIEKIADKILVINKATGRMFKSKKVEVLYDFVDLKVFNKDIKSNKLRKKLSWHEGELIIGFLGGIHILKGTLDFLKAADILLCNNRQLLKFVIIGKMNHFSSSRNIFRKLNYGWYLFKRYLERIKKISSCYKNNIWFLGIRNDIPELLSEIDIVVVSHKIPHSSLPVLEANAMAKPIIAYKHEEISEILKDKITGLLTYENNPEDLAEKINLLCMDKSLRLSLGLNGYKLAKKKYSSKAMEEQIKQLYKSLILEY